jgi:hypothetical protein
MKKCETELVEAEVAECESIDVSFEMAQEDVVSEFTPVTQE